MSWAKTNLAGAGYTLVVAVVVLFIAGGPSSSDALITAAVAFVIAGLLFVLAKYGARLARYLASLPIMAIVFGLRAWGESNRSKRGKDTLWDWFIDQLLVVQHRYAFSVGCIAFAKDNPKRCLMIRREFEGFDEPVILWPGGRLRATLEDFATEVRGIVQRETLCHVDLLSASSLGGSFARKIVTWNPQSGNADLENDLLAPPILVMQQNRRQSHDIPGHIDLLFLATVEPGLQTGKRGIWLDLDDMGSYSLRQLWPDTRECLKQASERYARMLAVTAAPPAGAP